MKTMHGCIQISQLYTQVFPATVVVSQYEMRSGSLTESHSSFQYHCEGRDVHVIDVSRDIVYVNFQV